VMFGVHLFALLKVSQACLQLAAGGMVGGQWKLAGWWEGSGGMGVVACLFFQCIMVWRRLPQARGSGS
jgi:hypothetical protein